MATSNKKIHEAVRKEYMDKVRTFLVEQGEDVLATASNEITMPWADKDGNEGYITLTFKIPTGGRDGTPYNGHEVRDDYAFKCAEKAKAEVAKAEAKAKKIAKDKAAREAKKAE